MKIKQLIYVFSVTALLALPLTRGFAMRNEDVELNLKLNKINFKIGDDFVSEIEIKNNKDQNVRILPWMGPYEYNWFQVVGPKGEEAKRDIKIIFELDQNFPYQKSYILLPPHGVHIVTFRARILGCDDDVKKEKKHDSVFIDFINSKLLLKNIGEYYIEAKFKSSEFAKEEAKKKYNFNNVWQGEITSNRVSFSISK